jgi:hypothetical protein
MKKDAIAKLLGLSIEEVEEALQEPDLSYITTSKQAKTEHRDAFFDSEKERFVMKRWVELSLAEIQSATTPEQAEEIYDNAPPESEAEKFALEKWLSLCENIEQVKVVFFRVPSESEAERLAFERWLSLCTSSEQVVDAFEFSDIYMGRLAIRKLAEMSDEEEE